VGREPLDNRLVEAIGALRGQKLGFAEIRRELHPLARKLGVEVPSYTTVRRVAIVEGEVAEVWQEAWEPIILKLLRGRIPTPAEVYRLQEARLHSELVRTLWP
jgi:hypothetical protein